MKKETFKKEIYKIREAQTPEQIEKLMEKLYNKTEKKHQELKEFWKNHLCM